MKKILLLLISISIVLGGYLQGREGVPSSWRKISKHDNYQDKEISFTFNLRQCNLNELVSNLWKVSNPNGEEYGKYMTLEEINSLVMCGGDSERMMAYISQFKISKVIPRGPAIKVTASIAVAEEMLGTTFFDFEHSASGKVFTRQIGAVSIPDELNEIVTFVSGISEFFHGSKFEPIGYKSNSKPKSKLGEYNPNLGGITDPYVTPSLLRMVYGIPSEPLTNEDNYIGIAAFDNDYDDFGLCRFQDLFNNYAEPPNVIYSGPEEGSDQVESDLDIQYSTAMANGIDAYFANHGSGEWILDWAQQTVQDEDRALVWSLSYGWPEVWQCQGNQSFITCPTGYDYEMYINATNMEIVKLGNMGVSVLVSSGDDGTPGFATNCPFDPNSYYNLAQMSCSSALADGNCQCGEIVAIATNPKGETAVCFLPNGLIYGTGCEDIDDYGLQLCEQAYNNFVATDNFQDGAYCNVSSSFSTTAATYFYSNCTCDAFAPVIISSSGYSCTIQGYSYNPKNGPAFLPDYPTSSPFVTSVGAVARQFSDECSPSIESDEIYCQSTNPSGFSGGGGFSSFQDMPEYQSSFVKDYLNTAPELPPTSAFNMFGRGYPDVSFNGHNYIVAIGLSAAAEGEQPTSINGNISPISGTSASSPAFAGMVARLNDYLLNNGLPSLGFLNPLLYTMAAEAPTTFTDIRAQEISIFNETVIGGDFTGCPQAYCCQFGFVVTPGWDPATGLGTPYFPDILQYIQKSWKLRKQEN